MQNQIPKNLPARSRKAKEGWQKVRLGNLGKVITGKTPPTGQKDYFANDFPFITPTDITDYDVRYNYTTERFISEKWANKAKSLRILKNSICFVCIGSTIGKMCLVKQDSFTNQQINSVVVDELKANPLFIYYLLKQNQKGILKEFGGGGAAKPIINKSTFENIELKVPQDVDIQKQIAFILSAFDDKIEINNKIAKTLEEMTQALFKEWFVKFRFPGHEKAEFVESELEKIPKGWKVENIEDICETFGGGTPSTGKEEYWQEGKINWATPTDMTSLKGPFIFETEKKINETGLKNSSTKLLLKDAILMTSRATVGILAISKIPICTNQGFISLVCKYPSNYFMYCFLKSRLQEIKGLATGSTFPEISRGVFRKIRIVVPDKEIVLMFDSLVGPMLEKIATIMLENQKLAALRDLLLPKLMRGEIRV